MLRPQTGEIYAELVLSGGGLERLYQALAALDGNTSGNLDAPTIARDALAGEPSCVEALGMFCALLGSAAGDFTVSSGSYGGCYLAGGILPRFPQFLADSDFHSRFINKAAMGERLKKVPIFLVTDAQPGLLGAAHDRC